MAMIETASDTRYCPRCGVQLDGQVDTCPACGQALCPVCGAQVDENATRCPSCGVIFELACPDCGAPLKPEDVRCSRCGAVFANPPPPSVNSKSAPSPSRDQVIQDGYRYGAQQMRAGIAGKALETRLGDKGFDPATAALMARNLDVAYARARRQQSQREIVSGVLAVVGSGLMFAVFSSFALQRPTVTVLDIVMGGLIIAGAIQVMRGLRHHAQGRRSVATVPQVISSVPIPEAATLWPSRLQNHRLLAGLLMLPLACVLADVLMTVTSLQVEATLIARPSAEINLRTSDLPADFQMLEDARPQKAVGQDTTDASVRVFAQGDHAIVSVVGRELHHIKGDLLETVPVFVSQASPDMTIGVPTEVEFGDQALLYDVTLDTPNGTRAGYLLLFSKQNVLVILMEVDRPGSLQRETILTHARIIEGRLR